MPTTAGTGSETTGTSIFDYTPKKFKTGIAFRQLKPLLGLIDPYNTRSMAPQVHVSTGLDVLCHSLESYTAIPYLERSPRPTNPKFRPAYQGSNPISDIWSLRSLKMCIDNLPRAYKNPDDHEAQEQMILAATFAGIGFGNAGVHLCHGMSYPISGLNKTYRHPDYKTEFPLVVSVVLNCWQHSLTIPFFFFSCSLMVFRSHYQLQLFLSLLPRPIRIVTWSVQSCLALTFQM